MNRWAILPIKVLELAKQRLSGLLSPAERRQLFQAMLEDLLAALQSSDCFTRIVLVSQDPLARLLATHYHAEWLMEEGEGLNAACDQGLAYAWSQGAEQVLVLHGDLPLVTRDDIRQLCLLPAPVVVPDRYGSGTNALLLSSSVVRCRFGEGSCAAHLDELAESELTLPQLWSSEHWQLDLDNPDDLRTLLLHWQQQGMPTARQTPQWLERSGVLQRLTLTVDCDVYDPQRSLA